jgi:hypothetical protein
MRKFVIEIFWKWFADYRIWASLIGIVSLVSAGLRGLTGWPPIFPASGWLVVAVIAAWAVALRTEWSSNNERNAEIKCDFALKDVIARIVNKNEFMALGDPMTMIKVDKGLSELREKAHQGMGRWGMPSPRFAIKGRSFDSGVMNVCNVSSRTGTDGSASRVDVLSRAQASLSMKSCPRARGLRFGSCSTIASSRSHSPPCQALQFGGIKLSRPDALGEFVDSLRIKGRTSSQQAPRCCGIVLETCQRARRASFRARPLPMVLKHPAGLLAVVAKGGKQMDDLDRTIDEFRMLRIGLFVQAIAVESRGLTNEERVLNDLERLRCDLKEILEKIERGDEQDLVELKSELDK